MVLKPKQCQAIKGVVSEDIAICDWLWKGHSIFRRLWLGALMSHSLGVSKSKKWQLALIVANPYQGGGKYSIWYGWCTRTLSLS